MITWKPDHDANDSSLPKYFRSVALIPDWAESNSKWSCVWDNVRSCFDFVTAERSGNESFRDCIHREVLEALSLTKRHVLVANMAQLNLEFVDALPESTSDSHIAVSFYLVHLYSRAARLAGKEMVEGRWLTGKELLNGETTDGWRVSPNLSYLLRRADVIQTW